MIKQIVESRWFHNFVITVILINGAVLGIETMKGLSATTVNWLERIDQLCLLIFVIELLMKMYVYRLSFFKQGWNVFDFVIVGIALLPATGELSILRAFRIFRLLRLVSAVDSIRRVVTGMLIAIPGVGSVAGLLVIFFYIGDWFGDLGNSMYTLFQIMTLESWSMGIVRPVMDVYPYAWIFFIPFIAVTTFTVLNLFIGIIVDALATVKEQDETSRHHQHSSKDDIDMLRQDINALREHLDTLVKDKERNS